ncbi:MAG: hypothetical protein WBM00_03925 [Solirubrobacterales bacterium]
MKKLLIAGALALTAVLGTSSSAVAAGIEEKGPPAQNVNGQLPHPITETLGLVINADTVYGAKPAPPAGIGGCSQNSLFPRNSRIVFRIWGTDQKHGGVPLSDQNVAVNAKNEPEAYVEVPGLAAPLKLKYGEHFTDNAKTKSTKFWTAGWTPGAEYPLGIVHFRVVIKTKPINTWVQSKVNSTTTKKTSKKSKKVPYIFRGVYTGKNSVKVEHGGAWVKKAGFIGKTFKFNLGTAKVTAEDSNADGTVNLSDVKAGDKVAVEARLPREDPGKQPFTASRLIEEWMIVVEPGQEGFYTQDGFAETSRLTIKE